MKRKWRILIPVALLALAGFIWIGRGPREAPITILGNPSAKDLDDLDEIITIARHEQWKSMLPDHSWPNVRALPHNFLFCLQSRVQNVVFDFRTRSAVVAIGKSEKGPGVYVIVIRKGTNGWEYPKPVPEWMWHEDY